MLCYVRNKLMVHVSRKATFYQKEHPATGHVWTLDTLIFYNIAVVSHGCIFVSVRYASLLSLKVFLPETRWPNATDQSEI